MAFVYGTGTFGGNFLNDFIAGIGNVSINNFIAGDDGDDVIIGDLTSAPYIIPTTQNVRSFATAANLDDSSFWTTSATGIVGTGTTPHIVVDFSASSQTGSTLFMAVTVGAGQTITVDTDITNAINGPSETDTVIQLYDSSFAGVAYDDDTSGDPGSQTSTSASLLSYTSSVAQTLYIQVAEFGLGGLFDDFEGDERFLINVSVTGHAATGLAGQGDDVLYGGGGKDIIYGDGGNDVLDGDGGNDTLYGGSGNDRIDASSGVDLAHGDDGDDTLYGGDDQLSLYFGDAGDDNFVVSVTYDTFATFHSFDGGSGSDTVYLASAATALTLDMTTGLTNHSASGEHYYNIENIYAGNGSDTIQGTEGANLIVGGLGDDVLIGRGGDDILRDELGHGINAFYGGSGNDILETSGLGFYYGEADNDEIRLKLLGSQTLDGGTGVDLVSLQAVGVQAMTVNMASGVTSVAGVIIRNFENLNGGAGVDTITGTSGVNVIDGKGGDDLLSGGSGDDLLLGGAGADRLDGGAGNDSLYGGAGSDTYVVNATGDVVDETGFDGFDTVEALINYVLPEGVEQLVQVTASLARVGTGNGAGNIMQGNALGNTLYGMGGADSLFGNSGNDLLFGGDGNDTLNGGEGIDRLDSGAGLDTLVGGNGNDIYLIDSLEDVIVETLTGGTGDVVETALFNYLLPENIETLRLKGQFGLLATGNDAGNVISGTSYDDVIHGGLGIDYIYGGNGADTLYGEGDNNALYGEQGRDTLVGGDATDQLYGGIGADYLQGGLGADRFNFDDGDFGGLSVISADRILDFSHAERDLIRLRDVDANTANGAATDENFNFIGTAAFSNVAGQLRYDIVGPNTIVKGDQNGDAVADFWIRLDGNITLISTDFVL